MIFVQLVAQNLNISSQDSDQMMYLSMSIPGLAFMVVLNEASFLFLFCSLPLTNIRTHLPLYS